MNASKSPIISAEDAQRIFDQWKSDPAAQAEFQLRLAELDKVYQSQLDALEETERLTAADLNIHVTCDNQVGKIKAPTKLCGSLFKIRTTIFAPPLPACRRKPASL